MDSTMLNKSHLSGPCKASTVRAVNYCQIEHVVGKVGQDPRFGLKGLVWNCTEGGGYRPFLEGATEAVFFKNSDAEHKNLTLMGKGKFTEIILTTAKYSFKKLLCLSIFFMIC